MLISVNIEFTKVTLFKNACGMYSGRSSQPRPQSSLSSQKHHGAEPNFISIHLSGYGGVHSQVKWMIQPTRAIILAKIKKLNQIINTQREDSLRQLT